MIQVDNGVLAWFREQVHLAGGGNYQTLINEALKFHIHPQQEPLEPALGQYYEKNWADQDREAKNATDDYSTGRNN